MTKSREPDPGTELDFPFTKGLAITSCCLGLLLLTLLVVRVGVGRFSLWMFLFGFVPYGLPALAARSSATSRTGRLVLALATGAIGVFGWVIVEETTPSWHPKTSEAIELWGVQYKLWGFQCVIAMFAAIFALGPRVFRAQTKATHHGLPRRARSLILHPRGDETEPEATTEDADSETERGFPPGRGLALISCGLGVVTLSVLMFRARLLYEDELWMALLLGVAPYGVTALAAVCPWTSQTGKLVLALAIGAIATFGLLIVLLAPFAGFEGMAAVVLWVFQCAIAVFAASFDLWARVLGWLSRLGADDTHQGIPRGVWLLMLTSPLLIIVLARLLK